MTEKRLKIAIAVLALLGIALASYLTYVHYSGTESLCITGESCQHVQTSTYAKLAGLPVALFGLIGYIAIALSLLIPRDLGRMITAALGIFGCGFSLYLTYTEIFLIKSICEWCVTSAVVLTLIAILAVCRVAFSSD